jgi:hypothetical protein
MKLSVQQLINEFETIEREYFLFSFETETAYIQPFSNEIKDLELNIGTFDSVDYDFFIAGNIGAYAIDKDLTRKEKKSYVKAMFIDSVENIKIV